MVKKWVQKYAVMKAKQGYPAIAVELTRLQEKTYKEILAGYFCFCHSIFLHAPFSTLFGSIK